MAYSPTNAGWGAAATWAKRPRQYWGTAGSGGSTATRRPPTSTRPAAPTDPYAGATSYVDEILKNLLGDVQRQKDAARQQAELEAGRKLAEGQALAYGLQKLGISKSVQDAFLNAGHAQAGLAQGFSGATRDTASAQAAEQQRMLSGTGQEGAVRNEGEAMGNVTYGAGGYIPASVLNTAGAAFGAQAALQPGFALQFGQLAKAERDRQWASELMGWADKEADVLSQKPKLMADAMDSVRDQQQALAKAKQDAAEFSYKRQQDSLDRKDKRTKAANDRKQKTLDRRLKVEKEKWDRLVDRERVRQGDARVAQGDARVRQGDVRLSTSQQSLELRASQYAQSNAQSWARIGVSDKNSQISAARNELAWKKYKSGGKTTVAGGVTPAQAQRYRRDAGKLASRAWNGVKETRMVDGERVTGTVNMTYQEAMREGIAQGVPLSVMQSALNTFWKKPGVAASWEKPGSGQGRPKVPFQMREPKQPRRASGKGVAIPTSFRSTHQTDGLGWPAVDIMGSPGTPVKAPEEGVIIRHGSAQGGEALYFQGKSGKVYWLGHIDGMAPVGSRVRRGQRIASISADHKAPHVHVAIRA